MLSINFINAFSFIIFLVLAPFIVMGVVMGRGTGRRVHPGQGRQRGELPAFVKDELRSFLACGTFAHGFARFRCVSCGQSWLVPFSCRSRGFCSSCTGRRMADQAAHLVDHVLPHVPIRQCVLSLPFDIRALVAFKSNLRRLVLREFLRVIYAWIRRQARK